MMAAMMEEDSGPGGASVPGMMEFRVNVDGSTVPSMGGSEAWFNVVRADVVLLGGNVTAARKKLGRHGKGAFGNASSTADREASCRQGPELMVDVGRPVTSAGAESSAAAKGWGTWRCQGVGMLPVMHGRGTWYCRFGGGGRCFGDS